MPVADQLLGLFGGAGCELGYQQMVDCQVHERAYERHSVPPGDQAATCLCQVVETRQLFSRQAAQQFGVALLCLGTLLPVFHCLGQLQHTTRSRGLLADQRQ
ncbi:hypothetical protein D9M68_576890 [compost metagenome]